MKRKTGHTKTLPFTIKVEYSVKPFLCGGHVQGKRGFVEMNGKNFRIVINPNQKAKQIIGTLAHEYFHVLATLAPIYEWGHKNPEMEDPYAEMVAALTMEAVKWCS